MKKCVVAIIYLAFSLFSISAFSQTENEPLALGLPGDNLNLYAVLDAFQNSPTLEEFERTLNDRDSNINNLDLNNDNATDYIEVVSNKEGSSFSIVLRVAINNNEYQDVAVIEGHKNYSGKVFVQIIGDEMLYGEDYIVEPSITETQNPGYVGNQNAVVTKTDVYYVNQWPMINYLFSPGFSVYVSPWHWGFYPTYWYSWKPVYYHEYWNYNRHYYVNNYYRRSSYIRYPQSHSYYVKRRQVSPIVRQHSRDGRYNGVYDGRTYNKPAAPNRRSVTPSTNRREAVPSSKQSTRRDAPSTTRQSTKQEAPQGPIPSTRQVTPSSTRSSSKPATSTGSSTRQVTPSSTRSSSKPATSTGSSTPQVTPSSTGSSSKPATSTGSSTRQITPSSTRSSSKQATSTTTRSSTRTERPATTRQQTKQVAPSTTSSGSRNSNTENSKREE